jgi:hypothetical protein
LLCGAFELDALPGAAYNASWFCCMDDAFVVWPHGSERLRASSTTYTIGTIVYSSQVTQIQVAMYISWTVIFTEDLMVSWIIKFIADILI